MIDRTTHNAQTSFEEANNHAINVILDSAETALLGIAVKHHLHGITVERWRWDQPEIVMSWFPYGRSPDLGKNIRVFVSVGGPTPFTCSVESNAWLDEHRPDNTIVRHWENFADHTVDISDPENLTELEIRWLRERIERAYNRFSESNECVLTQAVLIFPDGRSQPIEAPLRLANGIISNEVRETEE